jgi:hypothetical protein
MSKNKNMEIWNQVCISDPKTVKKLNYGFKPTVIDAQSQIKKATEIFGPFGIGFGIEKESRHFEDGVLYYSAILWYQWEGQTGAVAICSECKLDKQDVMKIAQTDAMTKGLSRIGFNSDIFEGNYDGNKYVEESKKPKQTKSVYQTKKEDEAICWDNTTKVQYGLKEVKEKTYKTCTLEELKQNKEYFGPITPKTDKNMKRHLLTIDAEIILREKESEDQKLGYDE